MDAFEGGFAAGFVARGEIDEDGAAVVDGGGGVLEGEVADDGEADAFVCAGYGGDAGEGGGHVV